MPASQSRQICHISPGRASGSSNQGPSCWAHYKAAAPHYQSEGKKARRGPWETPTPPWFAVISKMERSTFPASQLSFFHCFFHLHGVHSPTSLRSAALFSFSVPLISPPSSSPIYFSVLLFCLVLHCCLRILIGNFQRVTPAQLYFFPPFHPFALCLSQPGCVIRLPRRRYAPHHSHFLKFH